MTTAAKPKSVLLGFSTCPLCKGKTHVKRIDADGKRAYNHCQDEHRVDCKHTHYSTNATQERLMLEPMRAVKPLPSPSPAPTPAPEPAPAPPAPPKRKGFFEDLLP